MNGLDKIAHVLRENGIHVVDVADVGTPISAIVYSSQVDPHQQRDRDWEDHVTGGGVDDLILMLNADNLSIEEIVARIKAVW